MSNKELKLPYWDTNDIGYGSPVESKPMNEILKQNEYNDRYLLGCINAISDLGDFRDPLRAYKMFEVAKNENGIYYMSIQENNLNHTFEENDYWVELLGGGGSIKYLITPTLLADRTEVNVNDSVTLTASNVDPKASSLTWDLQGVSYKVTGGNLTGSLAKELTIKVLGKGSIIAKVKAVSKVLGFRDSEFSSPVTISTSGSVKPRIPAPVLSCDTSIKDIQDPFVVNIKYTDKSAVSKLVWDIKGADYEIVSGSISGEVIDSLELKGVKAGDLKISVVAVPVDNETYDNSLSSNIINVAITKIKIVKPFVNDINSQTISSQENINYIASKNENVKISLAINPEGVKSLEWVITGGSYEIVEGALTGSVKNSITIKPTAENSLSVKVRYIADPNNVNYRNSDFASLTIDASGSGVYDPSKIFKDYYLAPMRSSTGLNYTAKFGITFTTPKADLGFYLNSLDVDRMTPPYVFFGKVGDNAEILFKLDVPLEYKNADFCVEYPKDSKKFYKGNFADETSHPSSKKAQILTKVE